MAMKKQLKLNSILASYSSAYDGIGFQATVMLPDGKMINSVAGRADLKKEVPITFDHHLLIGSITKLFTAALVMQFVEQGRLALEDTLGKWYDYPYASSVTVQDLLNQTSGVPDYTQDLRFYARTILLPKVPWQPEQLVELLDGKSVLFPAGEKHNYSNSNYLLLGRILEKITGQSYIVLLREMIFKPLDLKESFILDYPHDLLVANGYDETIVNLGRRNTSSYRRSLESGAYSAGAIMSTSRDVASFTHALFNGELLKKKSLKAMQTFGEAEDIFIESQTGYGLGVRQLKLAGQTLVGHTGSIPGYSGISMHHPKKNYTISILCNLSIIDYVSVLEEIQMLALDRLA